MEIVLVIVAILCLLIGFVGCIVPVVPGLPLSWFALLLLKFTRFGDAMSWNSLLIAAAIVAGVTLVDYVIPAWGTKKFGGTRAGIWGSVIGLFVGLFFAPIGIIAGPFLGAFAGEVLISRQSGERSLRAAFGALMGFLLGVGLKFIVAACVAIFFFVTLFSHG